MNKKSPAGAGPIREGAFRAPTLPHKRSAYAPQPSPPAPPSHKPHACGSGRATRSAARCRTTTEPRPWAAGNGLPRSSASNSEARVESRLPSSCPPCRRRTARLAGTRNPEPRPGKKELPRLSRMRNRHPALHRRVHHEPAVRRLNGHCSSPTVLALFYERNLSDCRKGGKRDRQKRVRQTGRPGFSADHRKSRAHPSPHRKQPVDRHAQRTVARQRRRDAADREADPVHPQRQGP